jgi:hypothetical protein
MDPIFITSVSKKQEASVKLLKESLRTFGGKFSTAPMWVFSSTPENLEEIEDDQCRLIPLEVPNQISEYPFGNKVAACALAETLVPPGTRSLIWIDPCCLFTQPPLLFELDEDYDAAFRPVHIRNVGISPEASVDDFWKGIYSAVGVEDIQTNIKSFVDGQLIRTYFNSHGFSINPGLGLMERWLKKFKELVGDAGFQLVACNDDPHRIFLFQALLSALVVSAVETRRIRILPDTYNYPYHLQASIPVEKKLTSLNEAVCFAYEDCSIHSSNINGITLEDPLRRWLDERTSPNLLKEEYD